jgi:hypothetical protein
MTTPQVHDPWGSADHDPLDIPQPPTRTTQLTTAHGLLLARADMADALAHTGPTRRSYALSGADYAAAVLHASDADDHQRELATYYLADAEVLAQTPETP